MGDSNCRGCEKWEENIYWSHFQTVQFVQILSGYFDLQLAIPEKFATHVREKLADTVALKGPCGAIWNVALVEEGDNKLYLKHGWKEFVKEHSLQENDVLVFKYTGNSQFDVVMFDGLNSCEKEASYFLRRCGGHTERSRIDKTIASPAPIRYGFSEFASRDRTDDSYHETETNESSHEGFEMTTWKNPRFGDASVRLSSEAYGKPRKRPKSRSGTSSHVYPFQLESNRRPVTEEEKRRAIKAASATAVGDSFTVIMQECHVYKGFYLTIPADWARSHLPQRNVDVSLKINSKIWLTRCYYKGANSHGLAGAGWKRFAVENFLEKDDVCVFNLDKQSDDGLFFDVKIFRVVEEIVKPDKVSGSSSRKAKHMQ